MRLNAFLVYPVDRPFSGAEDNNAEGGLLSIVILYIHTVCNYVINNMARAVEYTAFLSRDHAEFLYPRAILSF